MPRKRVHVRNYQRKNGPVKEHDRGMNVSDERLQAAIAEARSPSLEWALSELEKDPSLLEGVVYMKFNISDPEGIQTVDELIESLYGESVSVGDEAKLRRIAEVALPLFPHILDAVEVWEERSKQYEVIELLSSMRSMTMENPNANMYVLGEEQYMPPTIIASDIDLPGQTELRDY